MDVREVKLRVKEISGQLADESVRKLWVENPKASLYGQIKSL